MGPHNPIFPPSCAHTYTHTHKDLFKFKLTKSKVEGEHCSSVTLNTSQALRAPEQSGTV
jgi:hypothetical protein